MQDELRSVRELVLLKPCRGTLIELHKLLDISKQVSQPLGSDIAFSFQFGRHEWLFQFGVDDQLRPFCSDARRLKRPSFGGNFLTTIVIPRHPSCGLLPYRRLSLDGNFASTRTSPLPFIIAPPR